MVEKSVKKSIPKKKDVAKKKTTKKKVVAKKVTKKKRGRPKGSKAKQVSKEEVEEKILSLFGNEREKSALDKIRDQLSPVEKLVWDKCIEALATTKAVSQWDRMSERLLNLSKQVEFADEGKEIEIDWDVSATSVLDFDAEIA